MRERDQDGADYSADETLVLPVPLSFFRILFFLSAFSPLSLVPFLAHYVLVESDCLGSLESDQNRTDNSEDKRSNNDASVRHAVRPVVWSVILRDERAPF
eukprot:837542-Rhodomonas_salina.1